MPFVTSARLHAIHNVAISNGRETLQQHGLMLDKVFPTHNNVNFRFVKFNICYPQEKLKHHKLGKLIKFIN